MHTIFNDNFNIIILPFDTMIMSITFWDMKAFTKKSIQNNSYKIIIENKIKTKKTFSP